MVDLLYDIDIYDANMEYIKNVSTIEVPHFFDTEFFYYICFNVFG